MDQISDPLSRKDASRVATSATGMDVSIDRLDKWITRGVINQHTGQRLYLYREKIGGQVAISRSAMSAFIAALNSRDPVANVAIGSPGVAAR